MENSEKKPKPIEILKIAFYKMPFEFTSQAFLNAARREGYTETMIKINNSFHQKFLHRYAYQPNGKRSKTWQKKDSDSMFKDSVIPPINKEINNAECDDDRAKRYIDFLKKLGCYKIQKLTEQWVDL